MQQTIIKTLIIKFLADKCTEAEKQLVIAALNTDQGKRLFDEVLQEQWNATTGENELTEIQLAQFNTELYQRIDKTGRNRVINLFRSNLFRYAGISIAVVAGLAIFLTQKKQINTHQAIAMREIINPHGKRSIITLPDSSVVYLGAGSKISFPENFADNKRDITLEGEAFFDVKHNPRQAFIVHTGNLQTRDIGTSFKITAFKNRSVTVALATGEVSIEHPEGKKMRVLARLLPGQQSEWKNDKLVTSTVPVNDISGWKDGRLVFDGVALSELTAVLERWYNVKININGNAKKRLKVTTRLNAATTSITSILQALSTMEHFAYTIEGRQITIK